MGRRVRLAGTVNAPLKCVSAPNTRMELTRVSWAVARLVGACYRIGQRRGDPRSRLAAHAPAVRFCRLIG